MKKNLSFEYAMNKLEEITQRLENGEENLEISVNLYQESVELINYCKEKLLNAEQKISILNEEETKC